MKGEISEVIFRPEKRTTAYWKNSFAIWETRYRYGEIHTPFSRPVIDMEKFMRHLAEPLPIWKNSCAIQQTRYRYGKIHAPFSRAITDLEKLIRHLA